MTGSTISHYKILEKLGEGGMGIVYKAEDTRLDRLVAIKFLPPSLSAGDEEKKRFILEAKTASSLDHVNICTIYEIDETQDGQLYMAMACYDGINLKSRIQGGPLEIREALQIALQIGQGLAKAHGRGIVHRDIKPANIIITPDGIAKILDFGIAKLVTTQNQSTPPGTTSGTVAYMSPEQTHGDQADQRADIWSLGVVLYEMISGQRPFSGDLEIALVYAINNEEPADVHTLRPEMDRHLQAILDRCLAKNPDDRFQTIEELIDALKICLQLETSPAAPAGLRGAFIHPPRRLAGSTPVRRIAASLVILILILVALTWFHRAPDNHIPLSKKVLAVFPFMVNGANEFKYLEQGMMDLLYSNLNGAGQLRAVDPRALLNQVRLLRKESPDIDEARKIARLFGARYYLMGSLIAVNGQLRFSAALYDADEEKQPAFPLSAEGDTGDLLALVDGMTNHIIARCLGAPADRLDLLGARTTQSLPALKAFLQGTQEDRDGHFTQAREFYTRAVELDSTFAIAWHNLGFLEWGYLAESDRARVFLQNAYRHSDKLSHHDRRLLDFLQAGLDGENDKAIEIAGQLVEEYPDDAWGWNQLATFWIQVANLSGHSILERSDAFNELLRLDPENATNYQQILRPAYLTGDLAEIDKYIAKLKQLSPDFNFGWMVLAPRAFITGKPADQMTILQEARRQDDNNLYAGIMNSAITAKNLSDLIPLVRLCLQPSRPLYMQASGYLFLTVLDMSRGKWRDAMTRLDTLDSLQPGYKQIFRGLYYPVYFSHIPGGQRRDKGMISAGWRSISQSNKMGTELEFAPIPGLLKPLEWYGKGLDCHFAQDSLQAAAYAAVLAAGEAPLEAKSLMHIWAATLYALHAQQQARPDSALALLSKEPLIMRFPLYWGPVYSTAFSRYLRADLLDELGRYNEALDWYRSIAESYFYDLPYRAPAAFKMARILEKQGRRREAIREYQRFLTLWQDCDQEFKAMTAEAEKQLAALR